MADILPVSQMIDHPNLLASFRQGQQLGQQQRVGRLYGQALSAPPDQRAGLVAQISQAGGMDAATNAQAGLGKMDDNARDDLTRSAAEFVALADQPDLAAQLYPQLAAKAHAVGLPVPQTYDPKMLPAIQKIASFGQSQVGGMVQSTYVDAQGNRVAIMRDGSVRPLGQNAPNNQIIDTGNGFYGVNKGNLQAAPVMVGGAPQTQAPATQFTGADGMPVQIDASLPPDVQASIRANEGAYAHAPNGATAAIGPQGQQLRSAPKPAPQITPYQAASLDLRRQSMDVAQQARADAAAAKKAAQDAAAGQKAEAAKARQGAAVESAQQLIDAIDGLTGSPGFNAIGTMTGDALTHVPFMRNDAKDAQAQLDNIAGQVALATMSRLKALSSQGATGFGSLSAPELKLLQNSISTLQAGQISHPQLVHSLQVIKAAMQKVADWHGQGAAPASNGWAIQEVR